MNIILIGMKNCGKSTLANLIVENWGWKLLKTDDLVENYYQKESKENLSCPEIFEKHGDDYFRQLETDVLKNLISNNLEKTVVDTGGGLPLKDENVDILHQLGRIVFLNLNEKSNYERLIKNGIPAIFTDKNNPYDSFTQMLEKRQPKYELAADLILDLNNESPQEVFEKFVDKYPQNK